jgi:phage N-6-adenine-methyltransferase
VNAKLTGPSMRRGKSKQNYQTPPDFISAVEKRFGMITFDLAADADNCVTGEHFDVEQDSLAQDWTKHDGLLWLNPPFADLAPWAARCAAFAGPSTRILLLTPASIGSNWFADHVHGKALVLALSPRLQFVGAADPYPRDLILSCYGFGVAGFDVWRWRENLGRAGSGREKGESNHGVR